MSDAVHPTMPTPLCVWVIPRYYKPLVDIMWGEAGVVKNYKV